MKLYKQIKEATNPKWLREMRKCEKQLTIFPEHELDLIAPYQLWIENWLSFPYSDQDVKEILYEPEDTEVDPEWEGFMKHFLKSSYNIIRVCKIQL